MSDVLVKYEESLINIDNVTRYLLDKKIIDVESVIDGDLRIIDTSRKNRNIKVIRKYGASLFIKQPIYVDLNSIAAIKRESSLYTLAQTDSDFESIKNIIPQILDFDDQKNILITKLIENGSSLNEYYFLSKGLIQKENMEILGKLLATYHQAFNTMINSKKLDFLPKAFIPFSIISRPGPEIFIHMSSANLHLLKIIQNYSIYDPIEELSSNWQSQTLIHGDIKWDNIIISADNQDHKPSMVITDWETASLGDPAWDVGGIFHEFIRFWLSLLPITGIETTEQLVTSTMFPIQNMQSAIRAFWQTYAKTNAFDAIQSNEFLVRSTKFCATRLIQTAYESLGSSAQMSNSIVYMVQIASNIFNNPDYAIVHLLGIPFRGHAS